MPDDEKKSKPPSAPPGHSPSDVPLLLEEDEGRVTMDFSGPPLALPADDSWVPEADSSEEPLSLELSDIEGDEAGEARDLVEQRGRQSMNIDLRAEMHERMALDDFTGALRAAELILGHVPEDPEATATVAECRNQLEALYVARLGGLYGFPRVIVKRSNIPWLGLDHRGGFLLSRIDGRHPVDELVDVSGMPRLETLKTLVDLLEAGTIRIESEPHEH